MYRQYLINHTYNTIILAMYSYTIYMKNSLLKNRITNYLRKHIVSLRINGKMTQNTCRKCRYTIDTTVLMSKVNQSPPLSRHNFEQKSVDKNAVLPFSSIMSGLTAAAAPATARPAAPRGLVCLPAMVGFSVH